ncbi:hypothetical protein [Mesotoga sp.]|uniref:hypothetical protein n=1 Tax=Mesotoga sp. TaxID=2053577 RepID=UPI00345EBC11
MNGKQKLATRDFILLKSGDPKGINGGIFTGKGVLPTHRALYIEVEDMNEIIKRVQDHGRRYFKALSNLVTPFLPFSPIPKGT